MSAGVRDRGRATGDAGHRLDLQRSVAHRLGRGLDRPVARDHLPALHDRHVHARLSAHGHRRMGLALDHPGVHPRRHELGAGRCEPSQHAGLSRRDTGIDRLCDLVS